MAGRSAAVLGRPWEESQPPLIKQAKGTRGKALKHQARSELRVQQRLWTATLREK